LKAGIPTAQLTLALEPEAASVFVKEMNVKREISDDRVSLTQYDPGTRYMVLDLGGRYYLNFAHLNKYPPFWII
jgi:hypothetical protein